MTRKETANVSCAIDGVHGSRRRAQGLPRLSRALEDFAYEARSEFDDVVRDHVGVLQRFVDQELKHLRAAGLLSSDEPSVEDVIDDTFVRALEDLPYRTEVTPIANWLTALASRVLEHEVALARRRDTEGMSGVGLRQLRQAHEGYSESGGPDGSAPASNVQGACTPEPEELLVAEELRTFLIEALVDLPTRWRRAVIFAHMDEQPLEAVAATLGTEVADVEAMLSHADAFLRARLVDKALSLPEEMSPAEFLAWPELPGGFARGIEAELTRLVDRADRVANCAPPSR